MPYGFGRQLPIVPPSLNDLNRPPNSCNILNTMAVVTQTQDDNDEYSPQSPEPSDPSPISTPPMNVSTFNSWETPHTTTDDNTFYSEDEPRCVYWTSPLDENFDSEDEPRRIYVLSSPSPPPLPRKMKRKSEIGMSFPKRRGASQHICEACGQNIPSAKDIQGPSNRRKKLQGHFKLIYKLLNSRFCPFKYPMYHVLLNLYLRYIVDTYPLSTHV